MTVFITAPDEEEGVKIAAGILRDVSYDSSQVVEILQIVGGKLLFLVHCNVSNL